jgi:cytochrome c-type biogenesis protein CcmH/NrfG
MTQLYASIAIGTAATMLMLFLFQVRANSLGHRWAMKLTQHWIGAGTRTSALVLTALTTIAVFSFAQVPTHDVDQADNAVAAHSSNNLADDKAVAELKAYADTIGAKPSSSLPDVDTMIAKLFARLEQHPDDVKGWKMLAWSYLNMDRAEEAAKAYATALKLDPNDADIKKGLEAAKSATTAAAQSPPTAPAASPSDVNVSRHPSDK